MQAARIGRSSTAAAYDMAASSGGVADLLMPSIDSTLRTLAR